LTSAGLVRKIINPNGGNSDSQSSKEIKNMAEAARSFPVIDPNVKHVGVSKLRELNATKLRDLDKTLVIQDDDTPLAVVLSYEQYLDMQAERENIIATLEALFEKDGKSSDLITALQQTRAGNVKPFSLVRRTLEKGSVRKEKER
jgi:hypothetical protein